MPGLMHYLLMTLGGGHGGGGFRERGEHPGRRDAHRAGGDGLSADRQTVLMIWLAAVGRQLSAVLGHVGAIDGPGGHLATRARTTAGMMAVAAGLLLTLAFLLGPRYGLLGRWLARRRYTPAR